jgi:hypothetical protein
MIHFTAVRLKVEQNQLVGGIGESCLKGGCLKSLDRKGAAPYGPSRTRNMPRPLENQESGMQPGK